MKHLQIMFSLCRLARLSLIIGCVLLLIAGCVTTRTNSELSAEVSNIFESGQIVPGYDYYYSGPAAKPLAIVAIHKEIAFDNALWTKAHFGKYPPWNLDAANFFSNRYRYSGSYILDQSGKRIGMWYSKEIYPYIIWETESKKLKIYTPALSFRPVNFL